MIYSQIPGCTDKLAINYNSAATINDGSCQYNETVVSPTKSVILPDYLDETSGLVYWANKIWTHNDDTDTKIYSFTPEDVNTVFSYNLKNVINKDWEEISQDEEYLYIGDFGNNSTGNRTDLRILRLAKSTVYSMNILIDTIWFKCLIILPIFAIWIGIIQLLGTNPQFPKLSRISYRYLIISLILITIGGFLIEILNFIMEGSIFSNFLRFLKFGIEFSGLLFIYLAAKYLHKMVKNSEKSPEIKIESKSLPNLNLDQE